MPRTSSSPLIGWVNSFLLLTLALLPILIFHDQIHFNAARFTEEWIKLIVVVFFGALIIDILHRRRETTSNIEIAETLINEALIAPCKALHLSLTTYKEEAAQGNVSRETLVILKTSWEALSLALASDYLIRNLPPHIAIKIVNTGIPDRKNASDSLARLLLSTDPSDENVADAESLLCRIEAFEKNFQAMLDLARNGSEPT